MTSGIYAIGTPSGKIYVGSARNLAERQKQHWRELKKGKHRNRILQNAYLKYGADRLTFVVLELCGVSELLTREQSYIDALPAELRINIALCAAAPMLGTTMPDHVKRKIAAAQIGVSKPRPDSAARARMSRAQTGRKQSAETIAKRMRAHIGATRADATRQKISDRAHQSRSTSGFRGVSLHKRSQTWQAYIDGSEKRRYLGYFAMPELAFCWRLVMLAAQQGQSHG